MFPGINPKKIQEAMSKMGIKQDNIEASRVIIECEDKNIIIEPADVVKINMQGQDSWQITGEAREEEKGISEEDIQTVMEKTGCSEDEAKSVLLETGDLAEAILKLSE